ncbi:hypothetical protein ABEB36_009048 [Hypothenemus hampei]|uniref:Phosphatidylinositol-glycan biosynthesis class X protein n=1 Tax=Hypothenemus hampei TaxID=57062 RepID=A0ABD1ENZ3_HYPHA
MFISVVSVLFSHLFIWNLLNVAAKNECIKLDLSIIQKIENLGFHRNLNWFVEAQTLDDKKWLNASCHTALKFNTGRALFVNPDQIDDLMRQEKLNVFIDGPVDVEAAAHQAKGNTIYIYLNSTAISKGISVKLPIHLRYQRSLMGGNGKVILTKPEFLVYCTDTSYKICGENQKVLAPPSVEDFQKIWAWKKLSYKAHFEETDLLVPVGNLDDYGYVAIITCILGCAGCIYILSVMSY